MTRKCPHCRRPALLVLPFVAIRKCPLCREDIRAPLWWNILRVVFRLLGAAFPLVALVLITLVPWPAAVVAIAVVIVVAIVLSAIDPMIAPFATPSEQPRVAADRAAPGG